MPTLHHSVRTLPILAAALSAMLACGDSDSPTKPEDAGPADADTATVTTDAGTSTTQKDASADEGDASAGETDAGAADADAGAEERPSAFSLRFAYTAGDRVLSCADTLTGQGSDGKNTVDINDVRFFVSDLRFLDADGKEVELTLDENDFQLHHSAGLVSLVDLTSNTAGGCSPDAFPDSEGTKRVHEALTGTTLVGKVASVRFNVGVPQAVMKKSIQDNTAEGQPSPLGDLQWPWSVGWRHFVLNFALHNEAGASGIGFVHLGSLDCSASMTDLALSDRDSCTYVNNPAVALDSFSLTDDVVTVDIPTILKKLDFIADQYDAQGNVTGQGPGVGCHSMPDQDDCKTVFPAFGLSLDTGKADVSKDSVFGAAKR